MVLENDEDREEEWEDLSTICYNIIIHWQMDCVLIALFMYADSCFLAGEQRQTLIKKFPVHIKNRRKHLPPTPQTSFFMCKCK